MAKKNKVDGEEKKRYALARCFTKTTQRNDGVYFSSSTETHTMHIDQNPLAQ